MLQKLETTVGGVFYCLFFVIVCGLLALPLENELSTRSDFAKSEGLHLAMGVLQGQVTIKDGKVTITPSAPPATPPASAPVAGDQPNDKPAVAPKGRFQEAYEHFCFNRNPNSTPGFLASWMKGTLLYAFFLCLGGVAGSLGGILRLLTSTAKDPKTTNLEVLLSPILGGIVCMLVGFLIFNIAQAAAKNMPILDSDLELVNIPVPVFYISFLMSMQPIKTITGIRRFISAQFEDFLQDNSKGN